MDEEGLSPILDVRANVDWLTLDTRTFYHSFPRLYDGVLNDVFTQKASMALVSCFTCSCCGQPPAPWGPGCRELALVSQTKAEHVATTNDHAHGWMQLAHRTLYAEGTTKAAGETFVGGTCPAMGQPTCASLFPKCHQSE